MLTVMMATRNGAGWIAQCLDSFCSLEEPAGSYKLVIIDNASTDGTADIVRTYMDRLPIMLLFQPKPGKNRALNFGLDHIEGDLVVFTDDDIIAAPDWLVQWRWAADQFPESGIFGGSINPYWRKTPPEWLLEIISPEMVYALTGARHQDGAIEPGLIYGPNMMVRADIFAGGHRFDETVGPDGSATYIMGSETAFTESMAARNIHCRFVSQPAVSHIIREGQVDPDWVAGRYSRYARLVARTFEKNYDGPRLFGAPRYLFRVILDHAIMKALYFVTGNSKLFYRHKFLYNESLGVLRELLNRKKSA